MDSHEIAVRRLINQQIALVPRQSAGKQLARFGAMQGQDYNGLKWSLALRLPDATEGSIERAIANRELVRSWLMRGTLHLSAAADLRWMLQLFAPRLIAGSAKRRLQIGLSDAEIGKCERHIIRALQGNQQLTRAELAERLRANGISMEGPRAYHIFWRIALGGLICFGLHQGKQPTFVLLEEWVPKVKPLSYQEALAELARRYFTSHGPATLQNFIWWSGLKVAEAREGLAAASGSLAKAVWNGENYYFVATRQPLPDLSRSAYLLSGFDEYLLGYSRRTDVLEPKYYNRIVPGNNGMFMPTLILGGRVAGTWQRSLKKDRVEIAVRPFRRLDKSWRPMIQIAAEHYARYAGVATAAVKFVR